MLNWNTDTTKFKTAKDKRIWEIVQMIEYNEGSETLNRAELKKYWDDIKTQIDPEKRRLYDYILWGKRYSLTTSNAFWNTSAQTKQLPLSST